MGGDSIPLENDNFDWDSEDDREIDNFDASSLPQVEARTGYAQANSLVGSSGTKVIDQFVGMGFSVELVAEAIRKNGEENTNLILEALLKYSDSSASSSSSKVIDHFLAMGFDEEMVVKAIQENGEENTDTILETLLTLQAIGKPPQEQLPIDSDPEGSLLDDFSDIESSESEVVAKESESDDEDGMITYLRTMGYSRNEATIAMERCGPDASIAELTDFLCAAQMAKDADVLYPEEKPKVKKFEFDSDYPKHKKRSYLEYDLWKKKRQKSCGNRVPVGDDEPLKLPSPMIGFGVPNEPGAVTHRNLPKAAVGPPYFYYENVACAPKGVWQTISRCLYDIEPEFVDSKFFCAAARKRGYVHNLPIDNRYPLLPLPPHTIEEALPLTKRWWPSWDTRTQLNCLQTCIASAKLTERIRKAIEDYDGNPPPAAQKFVMEQCRKWNLVWVGRNKAAPLEPDEVEMLLGFPKNHTRGGGISRTDRYKSLGNSFQVDTVAYHLSPLKDVYPKGLTLLSLFTGIGGAEVALHRLGIRLKNVVSVEISQANRDVLESWWRQTNQRGELEHINDVQELDHERLENLIDKYGGFDLIVGGSPCNNLTGSNRHHRDGLEGEHSALFYDYCRIVESVRTIMGGRGGYE